MSDEPSLDQDIEEVKKKLQQEKCSKRLNPKDGKRLPTDIVINRYYRQVESSDGTLTKEDTAATELEGFLKHECGCKILDDVNMLDLMHYENLVRSVEQAKHTISIATKASICPFTKNEEHYLKWLRSLHRTLDEDNMLTHIIFCVDVEAEEVPWYLRQFNPCVEYFTDPKDHDTDWKKELKEVLKLEKKSIKTLKHVNAGDALAWSHYTGYVRWLECIYNANESTSIWEDKGGRPVTKEAFMLVPIDCCCPEHFDGKNVKKKPCSSKKYKLKRAGKDRSMNSDLYFIEAKTEQGRQSLLDGDGKEKLVPITFTPSVQTLQCLKDDKDLGDKWLRDQRTRYVAVLKDLITNDKFLRERLFLIDEYDNDNLTDLIEKEVSGGNKKEEAASSGGEKEDKNEDWSIYIHTCKDHENAAQDIAKELTMEFPNMKQKTISDREGGKLKHRESTEKIEGCNQCIFLLTEKCDEKCYTLGARFAAEDCLDKVLGSGNRRAVILLYKKGLAEKHKEIFNVLLEHCVVQIEHGDDGWMSELKKAITEIQSRPLQSAVNYHNIAEGLAFGYLYGYLKRLPALSKKMDESAEFQKVLDWMPRKVVILMPKSGFCPTTLQKKDDTRLVQLPGAKRKIVPVYEDTAGQKRDFSVTEYHLKDKDGKEYYVAAEFMTPIQQLNEMQAEVFADMTYKQKRQQQRNLRKVMLEIEKNGLIPPEIRKIVKLLEIEDEVLPDDHEGKSVLVLTNDEKLDLYREKLLEWIKSDLQKDGNEQESVGLVHDHGVADLSLKDNGNEGCSGDVGC